MILDLRDFLDKTMAGDVLVYSSDTWLTRRIKKATNSIWSHVAMVTGSGLQIIEATWPRVREVDVTETVEDTQVLVALRPRTQTMEQARSRVKWAQRRDGWPYDTLSLAWWLLPDWLQGRKNWMSTRFPICSELAAWAMKRNGEYPFVDVPYTTIAPCDFHGCARFVEVARWTDGVVVPLQKVGWEDMHS